MDLNSRRTPLDAPGIPDVDGELSSRGGPGGQVQVEVIEHLRVKVPAAARQAWLEAEQASWEPWLQRQKGYLGRELHWDPERQEGQLLIRWASRALWHAIPQGDIELVQERFERHAHAALQRLGVLAPPSAEDLAAAPRAGLRSAAAAMAPSSSGSAQPPADAPGSAEAAPDQLERGASPARPANPFPLIYSGELPSDACP